MRETGMCAVSPDRTVEATLNQIDGLSITCRPGTLRYHTAASFARQVELSLSGLACHSDRATAASTAHRPGDDPTLLPDSEVPDIDVAAASPRGLVLIRLRGSIGYRVEVARTFGLFSESAIAEEVNAALHSVNERFAARTAALQTTPLQRALLGNSV